MSIRSEIEVRLKTWADAQSPVIPIAFEGVPFTKPLDLSPFLQAFLIPSITLNTSVDGVRVRELGMYQVNVWTKDGVGSKKGEDIAQGIVAAFPILPKTGTVSIEQTPHIASAIVDNGWRILPVTIKYRQEHT